MRRLHFILYLILLFVGTGIENGRAANNNKFVVVLDAGHGGKDPGAIGSKPANNEKTINLNVVKEVGRLLQNNCPDVQVIYTRQTDVFVPLDKRADIANKAKANLFISVHVNALPKNAKKAVGVQSYTLALRTASTNLEVEKRENSVIQFEPDGASKYSFANPNSTESDIMFELMQDKDMKESVKFAEMAQNEMVRTGRRNNMGVFQANLAVLRLTYMPSVLLEIGYISTPSEESFLITKNGQQTIAKCIYNAVARYKSRHTGQMSNLEKIEPAAPTKTTTTMTTATTTSATTTATTTTTTTTTKGQNEQGQKTETATTEESATTTENSTTTTTTTSTQSEPAKKEMYRVQILAGSVKLNNNDRQFKGLKVDVRKEGGIYKYTYGAVETMKEAQALKRSIADKFPGAFVVKY